MSQLNTILNFCKNASFYFIKFDSGKEGDLGRVISNTDILTIDLSKNEIHRSIEYTGDDKLFVYDTKPHGLVTKNSNPLQLIIDNKKEMEIIETVYPDLFTWAFDGVSIKAYAIVPSSDAKSHSTISRYGGTDMFIKILRQHLENLSNLYKGGSPNYSFFDNNTDINETELSVGSVNLFNSMYSVFITPDMDYMDILVNSKNNVQQDFELKKLNMKYWTREINPDFITEAHHISLDKFLSIDEGWTLYPKVIRNLMNTEHKGNYNRFLLVRFLLSVHKPHDAKFVYYSVLSPKELDHVKTGNCSTQWNYVLNNRKNYDCPTMKELIKFKDDEEDISHPLEKIQEYLNEKYKEE